MPNHIIDSPDLLESFCREMGSATLMAIDTEFVRVKTYYPRFCLMQVSSGGNVYCIDPLYENPDWGSLGGVLCAPEKTTVFHAARQDIEVLYQTFDDVPRRVFDTQVAAAMAGLGDQIGYANLVEIVTGRALAKAHTRTDWCQRPLSRDQITYAVDDVRYLETIFHHLGSELDKRGRLGWVYEECRPLSDVELYRSDPESAYKRVGHGDKLDPAAQCVLKELAIWRERTSQLMDLPRNWIVKDKILALIAQNLPDSREKLANVEGVPEKFARRHGEQLVQLVRKVLRKGSYPVVWRKKLPLSPEQRALQKQILNCLKRVAADSGISPGVLGSRHDVDRLVRGSRDVNLLSGWRAQLLGSELNKLLG